MPVLHHAVCNDMFQKSSFAQAAKASEQTTSDSMNERRITGTSLLASHGRTGRRLPRAAYGIKQDSNGCDR